MRVVQVTAIVFALGTACSHPKGEGRPTPTGSVQPPLPPPQVETGSDATLLGVRATPPIPIADLTPREPRSAEEVDRDLESMFPGEIPRSVEQLKAVAAAAAAVDESIVPEPRRYLVRRSAVGWDVTILSLDAWRSHRTANEVTVHLAVKQRKLVVVALSAPG